MNPRIEKLLKLPLWQRGLVLLGTVVLIVAGFIYLVFLPQLEQYGELQERNRTLQTKVEEDRRIADNLPKFKAEYEKMQERLEQALTELPNEKEIPALLTSIASLAKDNGLDILRFQPAGEVPKGFYAEVPVQLKMTGSYHDIALFSQAIGDLPRIVNINDLSIGSAKDIEGRTLLAIECVAVTFRFLDGGKGK